MRLPILMYHHVGEPQPGSNPMLSVPLDEFRKQIEWLSKQGYHTLSDVELCAIYGPARKEIPSKSVVLTFDDAYADLAKNALPVLRQLGFTAIVFVVTQRIGKTSDWDEASGFRPMPLMDAEAIKAWASQEICFGGHSRAHFDLSKADDPQIESEVAGCAVDLRELGITPRCFAYPYGGYNSPAQRSVTRNFQLGLSIDTGINDEDSDPSCLKRLWIYPRHSLIDLRCQVRFGKNPIYGVGKRFGKLFKA